MSEFLLLVAVVLLIVVLIRVNQMILRQADLAQMIQRLGVGRDRVMPESPLAARAEPRPVAETRPEPEPSPPSAAPTPAPSEGTSPAAAPASHLPPPLPPPGAAPRPRPWADHPAPIPVRLPAAALRAERPVEGLAARPIPTTPPPPPAPGRVEEILGRIGRWILVGEEYRNPKVSAEFAIASTWLIRAGIVLIVACVGYFLMWSIEKGFVGPLGRTALATATGLVMLVGGTRLFGKAYHLMGQGLVGGGLATLYFSAYAAGPLYNLVSTPSAFGLMILVTTAAGVLAWRVDSMLVAILGLLGGLATPVMLSTGQANFLVLYSYLFLLGLGVLGLSRVKPWRLLNYLAFLGTWVLVFASLTRYKPADYPVVISLLAALFVLHTLIVYGHHLARGARTTVLETLYLVANALVFPPVGVALTIRAHDKATASLVTFGVALFYAIQVFALLRLKRGDRRLLVTLIALAGLFTALTMPLLFEKATLTMTWALLALMFLWIAHQVESPFLRGLSGVLFVWTTLKLCTVDVAANFGSRIPGPATWADYLRQLGDRAWTFIVSIAALFLGSRIESVRLRRQAEAGGTESLNGVIASRALATGAVAALMLVLHFEVNSAFSLAPLFRLPMMTVLWAGLAAWFLVRFASSGRSIHLAIVGAALTVGTFKLLIVDMASWRIGLDWVPAGAYSTTAVLARTLDFGVILAVLLAAYLLTRRAARGTEGALFGYTGLGVLLIFLTLELNALLDFAQPGLRSGGISALWAVYAMVLLVVGIARNRKGLRYPSLVLFTVVVAKVMLHDLSGTKPIHKVIALLVIGVALLLGAFAYLKAAPKFRDDDDDEPPPGPADPEAGP